jgi:hypothetical protein
LGAILIAWVLEHATPANSSYRGHNKEIEIMKLLYIALASLVTVLGTLPFEVQANPVTPPVLEANGDIEGQGLARKLLSSEEMKTFTTDIQEATTTEDKRAIQEAFRELVLERAQARGVEMRSEQARERSTGSRPEGSGAQGSGREAGDSNSGGRDSAGRGN